MTKEGDSKYHYGMTKKHAEAFCAHIKGQEDAPSEYALRTVKLSSERRAAVSLEDVVSAAMINLLREKRLLDKALRLRSGFLINARLLKAHDFERVFGHCADAEFLRDLEISYADWRRAVARRLGMSYFNLVLETCFQGHDFKKVADERGIDYRTVKARVVTALQVPTEREEPTPPPDDLQVKWTGVKGCWNSFMAIVAARLKD